jgi:hypothetical protein
MLPSVVGESQAWREPIFSLVQKDAAHEEVRSLPAGMEQVNQNWLRGQKKRPATQNAGAPGSRQHSLYF